LNISSFFLSIYIFNFNFCKSQFQAEIVFQQTIQNKRNTTWRKCYILTLYSNGTGHQYEQNEQLPLILTELIVYKKRKKNTTTHTLLLDRTFCSYFWTFLEAGYIFQFFFFNYYYFHSLKNVYLITVESFLLQQLWQHN
jgi:hypothetical protein